MTSAHTRLLDGKVAASAGARRVGERVGELRPRADLQFAKRALLRCISTVRRVTNSAWRLAFQPLFIWWALASVPAASQLLRRIEAVPRVAR